MGYIKELQVGQASRWLSVSAVLDPHGRVAVCGWGVPTIFLVVGLTGLGWVAAEMHLGRPVEFPLGQTKFARLGYVVLSAAAFLFFVWWVFKEIQRAKKLRG